MFYFFKRGWYNERVNRLRPKYKSIRSSFSPLSYCNSGVPNGAPLLFVFLKEFYKGSIDKRSIFIYTYYYGSNQYRSNQYQSTEKRLRFNGAQNYTKRLFSYPIERYFYRADLQTGYNYLLLRHGNGFWLNGVRAVIGNEKKFSAYESHCLYSLSGAIVYVLFCS